MSEIIFQGKGQPVIPIPAGETWTVKFAAYDSFGLIGLIESAPADVDTLEVLVDIPPASIDITKFASGITPVGLVDVLPNPVGYVGAEVVLLSTDMQLYRYTGTGWTSAVPAVSITGSLTAAQIASVNATAIAGTLTAAQIASINAAQIVGSLVAAQIASVNATAIAGTLLAAQISSVNAVAIAGTITSTQIANDAITTPKIATGAITADEIAAGSVVAGKIAANAVTAGTIAANAVTAGTIAAGAVVAGTIAANAVTATEIAAGAITASEIAANAITAVAISAGAITAGKLAAGAVVAGTIAAGAVTAGTIAANAVTANEIAANSITASELAANSVIAGKIAAGAISATEIATGAITADRLASGGRNNMYHNGAFYNQVVSENMFYAGGTFGSVSNVAYANPDTSWSVNNEVRGTIGHNHNISQGGTYGVWTLSFRDTAGQVNWRIPVREGQRYELSGYLAAHRCRHSLQIIWLNGADADIGSTANTDTVTEVGYGGGANLASYKRVSTFATAPSTAKWAALRWVREATLAGNTDSWAWITRVMFTETTATATELTPWSPPGTTLIQGGSIATGSVTADQIAANSITAAKIAAGAITADKVTTTSLSALSANLGAITAGSININNKFIVDSAGNVTLQSSPTGQRLVLTNSRLEVYDASNVLRVRLGIW